MVVLPILLLSVVAACEGDLKPAILALQQNDAAKAMAILNGVQSQCAQSSAFYELLGVANELAGRTTAAEEALRTAVSLDSGSSRLLTELGATYLRNGKTTEAAKALDKALALDPDNPETLKYAIGAAVRSQDWPRADSLFQQVGGKNPAVLQQEPILILWFAQTLIATNQRDRIDPLLTPLRKFMPPNLLFSLGTLLAQAGMYPQAIDYLRQVPPQNADDALYFNLGLSYSHLQKFADARECYFQAIDKHAGHADAYLHVGLDYASDGDAGMAIPWLLRAHSFAPARPDITYAFAEQLIALEYFDTAKDVLADALESHPNDALLLVAEGDLKRSRGDAAGAIESCQKALAEQPGLAAALICVARAEIHEGQESEAKASLKAALAAHPQDSSANGELGSARSSTGRLGFCTGPFEPGVGPRPVKSKDCAGAGSRVQPERPASRCPSSSSAARHPHERLLILSF